MSELQDGTVVLVSYIGKIDNGDVFKTTSPEEPVKAIIGDSELPPTLEEAVKKMSVGETVKVRVPPEEGYGPRQKLLTQEIGNKEFIEKINPKPGMIINLNAKKEGIEEPVPVPATVIEVKEDVVVVDYNHPLAGHHLTYELTLESVE
ncbi:MAG: FKBP-type peptidyl-prolyl cis-trans isomerase [Desulfotalea sp.]